MYCSKLEDGMLRELECFMTSLCSSYTHESCMLKCDVFKALNTTSVDINVLIKKKYFLGSLISYVYV